MASSSLEQVQQNLARVRHQQAALAAFGSFAFRETNLLAILTEAAQACASGLGVGRAKVCQYRPKQNDLLIVAGFGWHKGVINQVVSQADESSPQGRAFITGKPVISKDLAKDNGFVLPDFYAEHGIVSTIDVIVKGVAGPPFGILEIDSTKSRAYDEHDINFLTGFANILAEAVATAGRVEKLQTLIDEKDQLLADKVVLAKELQHRVRNNLQLVGGMLAAQVKQTSNPHDQDGLRGIQARLTALSKVYDQLLGVGLSREIEFSAYAKSLCAGLPGLQNPGTASVVLTCDVAPMVLDLDAVTALGLAMTELVANSYKHAFPDRHGHIAVSGGPAQRPGWGELIIKDDGIGYHKTERELKRHGVGLVSRLLQQVSGSVAVDVNGGTAWTLAFPIVAPKTSPPIESSGRQN